MPLMQKKNTKLYLTFSEETYTLLERWGKAVSRPLTNLGVYIIEQAIRQALADGTIPIGGSFLQIQPEHAIYDFLGCLPVPPFPTGQLYKLLWSGHTKMFAHFSEGLAIALP